MRLAGTKAVAAFAVLSVGLGLAPPASAQAASTASNWTGLIQPAVATNVPMRATRIFYLQCVAYAHMATGIAIMGNAKDWWANAAGHYARGDVPEPGSVLAFKSNWHMPLGHVAVVARVVNSREIIINQANWWGPGGVPGGIAYNIPVIDVSPRNDWTSVRVALGHTDHVFGSIYPTFGFIYKRPDTGVMIEASGGPGKLPAANPAPSDFRSAADRAAAAVAARTSYPEVAQAPGAAPLGLDAPDRRLR